MKEFVSIFSEYGLIGLIIGSLFFLVFTFVWIVERRDRTHSTFVKFLLSESKDERNSTTERFSETSDKLAKSIDELAIAIENQKNSKHE